MRRLIQPSGEVRALWRNCRGVAAAEFALIAPAILTLMLAAYDIGNAVQERMQLEQAVRAGAQYALSWPDDTQGITNAINYALPWTPTTINVSLACWCWSSSAGETESSCPATCPNGSVNRSYVTLTATNNATPFLFSAVTGNSATYVVRVQ